MKRLILAFAAALCTTATATAQYQQPYPAGPFYQPQNIMPNIYNPANQPLSPYLLTTRGIPRLGAVLLRYAAGDLGRHRVRAGRAVHCPRRESAAFLPATGERTGSVTVAGGRQG